MLPGLASQTLFIASIMRARRRSFDAPAVFKSVPQAQYFGVVTEFGGPRVPMASSMCSMFGVRSRVH